MNSTIFRFTLSNTTLGSKVIQDPIGWDTAPLQLERHKDYYGVIETFASSVTFHHDGLDYLILARALGPDANVTLTNEISEDGGTTFETFFVGLVDGESLLEIDYPTAYKISGEILNNDLWTTFLNRKSISVDINSATDLDGNAVAATPIHTIPLPTQVVPQVYQGNVVTVTGYDDIAALEYIQFDFDQDIYDEITKKFHLPIGVNALVPVSLWTVDYAGELSATINASFFKSPAGGGTPTAPGANLSLFLRLVSSVGNFTDYAFTRADFADRSDYSLVFPPTSLGMGFQIILYGKANGPFTVGANTQLFIKGIQASLNYDTVFADSNTEAILTHDIAGAIIKRITPGDFYSEFFGGIAQGYAANGCGFPFVNMLGLHLRGNTIANKPLSTTFDNWFGSANAIWNIGLAMEKVGGVDKIRCEEKSYFFDSSSNSINIANVNNVQRSIRKGQMYKSITNGNSKWQLTSGGSAIDDPQSQHIYASILRTIGQNFTILCDWISASLLFELARRAARDPNKTFDTDNDIFVLYVKEDLSGPNLDGTAVNLRNYTTRYNKILTPARAFLRWLNIFNIGLQASVGRFFTFTKGVGNFLASITIVPNTCRGTEVDTVTENENIEITNDALFGLEQLEFEHDLTWTEYKLIRDNRNKSVGVSETGEDFVPYFIDKISFYLWQRKAKFVLFKAVA